MTGTAPLSLTVGVVPTTVYISRCEKSLIAVTKPFAELLKMFAGCGVKSIGANLCPLSDGHVVTVVPFAGFGNVMIAESIATPVVRLNSLAPMIIWLLLLPSLP